MIQEILKKWRQCDFDFRIFTCPEDELSHHFDSWVPYYRLKYAIAQVLDPQTILEIGVRYGYSAAAFMNACPSATYTGIDLDVDTYGGTKGAIDWARKILPPERSNLIVADTQKMSRLPGGHYDLIHVDGQQDEEAVYHDLEMALNQSSHALVDGYLWTEKNFRGVNEFILHHKDLIEFYWVIPGYAGELLIKFQDSRAKWNECNLESAARTTSSGVLRSSYTEAYFLQDCDGYDSFKHTKGKGITNPRLQSMLELGNLSQPKRLLDLGCGRGELAYQFAKIGCEVTAVDYSEAAISLAKSCFTGESEVEDRVRFLCGNACEMVFDGEFDAILASDLIEHLSPEEVLRLYENVARNLAEGGLFGVHTYPNKWFYQYEHARKRRIAKTIGAYLPVNPRSRYERMMHINEQSPRVLKKQLSEYFPHVLMWFGSPSDSGGSLLRDYTIKDLAAARDLFALASTRPIDQPEVMSLWQMQRLENEAARHIELKLVHCPDAIRRGEFFQVQVEIRNLSRRRLSNCQPYPVHIAYHWWNPCTGEYSVFDGRRSGIIPSLAAGQTRIFDADITAPECTEHLVLQMRLVQENVLWIEASEAADHPMRVSL